MKALPLLGAEPFFHINSDTIWIEGVTPNLSRLARAVRSRARWTSLLLLAATTAQHRLRRARRFHRCCRTGGSGAAPSARSTPFVYAGAAILSPAIFAGARVEKFSLNRMFDKAMEAGRLFGLRLEGTWMHVGTPAAIKAAEAAILQSVA